MSRTTIDLDDDLVATVMERYDLPTKKQAVYFALGHLDAGLDFRGAVEVFWAARGAGRQPRGVADCVIAAVAMRHGVPLASRDADLVHIGRATGLDVVDLR